MKVLYVSTISNTINAFMVPHIVMLLDQGHEVHIACNIQKDIKPYLIERGCKIFNIKFQRSPLKKQNYNSYIQLKKIIEQEYYDIVHTHTPVASTIVRLACKNNKNVKVIYTAHGFHFYKGAPLKNWLIYYPIEKWLSRYTDKLITITKEDFNLANKKFYSNVYYIPGAGVDPDRYSSYNKTYIKELRKSLGYDNQQFLLLCIGELNQNKNQSTIIKAIKETLNEFADIKLLLAGKGPLERNLKSMVKAMNLENKVEFLGYRTDLEKYINICDVIITASLREGLPLNVMEGMVCEKPIIASKNRGHKELIQPMITGYLNNPKDYQGFSKDIINLKENIHIRTSFGEAGKKAIEPFLIENIINKLKKIYEI